MQTSRGKGKTKNKTKNSQKHIMRKEEAMGKLESAMLKLVIALCLQILLNHFQYPELPCME
jgi:hypothetical protein